MSCDERCSHSKVLRVTTTVTGGYSTHHWQCAKCPMSFVPETKKCEEKCEIIFRCKVCASLLDECVIKECPCKCHQKEEKCICADAPCKCHTPKEEAMHTEVMPCCGAILQCPKQPKGCGHLTRGDDPTCVKCGYNPEEPKPDYCGCEDPSWVPSQFIGLFCTNCKRYVNPLNEPKEPEKCEHTYKYDKKYRWYWCEFCEQPMPHDYYTREEIDNLIIDAKIQTKKVMWDEEKEFRRELLEALSTFFVAYRKDSQTGKTEKGWAFDIESLRKKFL